MAEVKYLVSDNETLKWQTGDTAYCLHIMSDDCPQSPLQYEEQIKFAFFGRNNHMGNDPQAKTLNSEEYLVQLCREHVNPNNVIEKIKSGALPYTIKQESNGTITVTDTKNSDTFEGIHPDSIIDILADNLTPCECNTLLKDVMCIAPIWVYEHSGITITTGPRTYPYNDQFDSYFSGYAWMTKTDAEQNWPNEPDWAKCAKAAIDTLAKTYDSYLQGDVWGYQLYTLNTSKPIDTNEPAWEEDESVWGFIDSDIVASGLAESVGCGLLDAIQENRVISDKAKKIVTTTWQFGQPNKESES